MQFRVLPHAGPLQFRIRLKLVVVALTRGKTTMMKTRFTEGACALGPGESPPADVFGCCGAVRRRFTPGRALWQQRQMSQNCRASGQLSSVLGVRQGGNQMNQGAVVHTPASLDMGNCRADLSSSLRSSASRSRFCTSSLPRS